MSAYLEPVLKNLMTGQSSLSLSPTKRGVIKSENWVTLLMDGS